MRVSARAAATIVEWRGLDGDRAANLRSEGFSKHDATAIICSTLPLPNLAWPATSTTSTRPRPQAQPRTADADQTYDFAEIPHFVAQLDEGADMVIGNRMNNILPGTMPWLHRYIGNPVLNGFLNLLYGVRLGDGRARGQGEPAFMVPGMAMLVAGLLISRAAGEAIASTAQALQAISGSQSRSDPCSRAGAPGEDRSSDALTGWRVRLCGNVACPPSHHPLLWQDRPWNQPSRRDWRFDWRNA